MESMTFVTPKEILRTIQAIQELGVIDEHHSIESDGDSRVRIATGLSASGFHHSGMCLLAFRDAAIEVGLEVLAEEFGMGEVVSCHIDVDIGEGESIDELS
jgi:hypothetical protein